MALAQADQFNPKAERGGRRDEALTRDGLPGAEVELTFDNNQTAGLVFGHYDQNLAHLERRLGVVVSPNGNHVTIKGPRETAEQASWGEVFGRSMRRPLMVGLGLAIFQQITGIMFPVFSVMASVNPETGTTPLNDGLLVCGQIAIVLIGAFPMVKWITKTFGKALEKVGSALGMNEIGSAGMVANLANNIAMFNILGDMNPKGKLLNVAFAVSAAFVFGDPLRFTAGNEPEMIFPVIVGKLVAGITAVILANILSPKLLSKIESTKM